MAGTITHLVIADMLLKTMPEDILSCIHNRALFYCGNLAPDAIMAREGYVREMKKHTHFKDGIPEDELAKPENFRLYRSRFENFAKHFLVDNHSNYELYLGYVTHMLADEIFILTVRDRHVEAFRREQAEPDYKEYFTMFGHDVDLNDWRLLRKYDFSCSILEAIQSENNYMIEGYITKEELIKSKNYIIDKNFKAPHKNEEPKVFTYEENYEFIQRAVERITRALCAKSLSVTDESESSSAI